MKIFYAVQATGNGHIARAMELMPYLQKYGEVDVFLSGSNSTLNAALPVKYRSKGLCLFYNDRGGLDIMKMVKEFKPLSMWNEAKQLPIEQYDIVINDFECVTSLACKIKKIPSIQFSHQASFRSANTPKPDKKDFVGELVLNKYATSQSYVGLHFEAYDDFICPPIIKDDILAAQPTDEGHITVYLSHYSDENVAAQLMKIKGIKFEVFSKNVKHPTIQNNITFLPVGKEAFNYSMIRSHGVITGAGFETPAEALYLKKKLLCLPIMGQYEQLCNAAALERFNVPILKDMNGNFVGEIDKWLSSPQHKPLQLTHSTDQVVALVIEKALELNKYEEPSNFQIPQTEHIFISPQYSFQ
jgi:uncharacterized protein (TIGR00661 family)